MVYVTTAYLLEYTPGAFFSNLVYVQERRLIVAECALFGC